MPVISFFSSKGGAGKTTTAMVVAATLHKLGFNIQVIDADQNLPIMSWAEDRGGDSSPFSIISCLDDREIAKVIKQSALEYDFVLVDVEGSKNMKAAHAISKSDLVMIPSQRSVLDQKQAVEAVQFIFAQQNVLDRKINFCLTITNTSEAIITKNYKKMRSSLRNGNFNVCGVELFHREAFKNIFDYSKTLYEMMESLQLNKAEQLRIQKAIVNGEEFTAEILTILNKETSTASHESEVRNVA